MAPKRKSKADTPVSDSDAASSTEEAPQKKAKKATKTKEPVKPLDPTLPTNTVIPPDLLTFESKAEGVVRIATWNVCGIKACDKKGLRQYVAAEDADILVLCETKTGEPDIADLTAKYPYRYWGVDPKKGNAGTAILSKLEPIQVTFGMPTTKEPQSESAGRIVTLEFANSFVVGTYVQNAGMKLANMDKKEAWNAAFEVYLRQLDSKKPVVWTGDLNVVPTEKDIRNWSTNYNKSPGCTEKEITAYMAQLHPAPDSGHQKLVDVWRHLHQDVVGYYTYFSYKFQCRIKGIGWRLDSFIVSERILTKVKQCEIRLTIYGASDHVPVVLDIEGPL
ncbi:hypothetical protein T439DRAFT_322519 [Meredithblackwellia eburnea MCA 4105]